MLLSGTYVLIILRFCDNRNFKTVVNISNFNGQCLGSKLLKKITLIHKIFGIFLSLNLELSKNSIMNQYHISFYVNVKNVYVIQIIAI